MSKLKKFVFSLVLLIVSLTLSLLAVEAILRWYGIPTKDLYTATETEFHNITGIYMPNQKINRTKNKNLPHEVVINSLGYRGRDFPWEKPKGEIRIFMAGDSLVFGDFVGENETLPAQLESLLRVRCGNIRVINAGLLGGTITGETQLIERGLVLDPDMVVLAFHENDIGNMISPLWLRLARNREIKSQFPMSWVYPIAREMAVWNYSLKVKERIRLAIDIQSKRNSEPDIKLEKSIRLIESKSFREEYKNELHKIRDLLLARNIAFNFVIYPGHHAVKGREDVLEIVQWAQDTATSLGINVMNLLGPLQQNFIDPNDAYLLPWDGHPSAKGHSVSATALSEHLLELEPIRSVCH